MSSKPDLRVLEMLSQMRQRDVERTRGKLMQQKQICQRYNRNIEVLHTLSDSSSGMAAGAAQMINQARFKATIQRVIGWQEQEKALAIIEESAIQHELIEQACSEMTINVVMEQQKVALRQALDRDQQKLTDAQAMQSWMRKQTTTRLR